MLAWQPGDAVQRRVRALLPDRATGAGRDVTVSLTTGAVVRDSRSFRPADQRELS
ncbi:primary-amine oxidase [Blastococcus sp. DSM 46786]|uniref:hypothetical protein n=1 Tax=Blastococcus sp. DSM 46786 TaxID=1798227 RepID=UPI0008C3882C|nr:hypothetical protein [Blastococcus sp. DSM 46786]SEM09915.1 primary-amine oxidase [Blastococcus sp. DSM 46786]